MYRRDKSHTLSSFIGNDAKIEEEKGEFDQEDFYDSGDVEYRRPVLDPLNQGLINQFWLHPVVSFCANVSVLFALKIHSLFVVFRNEIKK